MATYKIKDKQTGQVFTVRDKQDTGEIMTPETMKRQQFQRYSQNIMPNVGQYVGGLAGAVPGLAVGHPYLGSAAGGVTGRQLGNLMQQQTQQLQKQPVKTLFNIAKDPIGYPVRNVMQMSPQQRENLGRDIGYTTVVESATAPLGLGLNKLGRGLVKTFIPREIAQRGFQQGFKRMLNPEFYKGRLPEWVTKAVSGMFDINQNRYGQEVSNAVKNPEYKLINIFKMKDNLKKFLKEIGINNISDIDNLDISTRDKNLIKANLTKIMRLGQAQTPETLWNRRVDFDKLRYSKSWKPEATEVLDKIRYSLNEPIKASGKNIEKAFDNYTFLMQAKEELKNKTASFIQHKQTGEIFSPDIAKFVGNAMAPTNEAAEIRALVKSIDPNVANIIFDAGSASVLGKQTLFRGSPYSTLMGKIVDPRLMANLAQFGQRPSIQFGRQAIGRTVPTVLRLGMGEQ